MNRHDTHILSESEEDEEKCEKKHKYSFNDLNNSNCSSEKISEHSNSKKNSPFKLEPLKTNNSNNNNKNCNNSLISIKDIEDIFYNEKSTSTKENHIEENNKEEDNINDKDNNNIKYDNHIYSFDNKKENSRQSKKEKSNEKKNEKSNDNKYDFNNSKKDDIKKDVKKINIKEKFNSNNKRKLQINKENVKIKLLKINNDEYPYKKNYNIITYNPTLKKKLNISNYLEERRCVSLNNIFHKSNNILIKHKNFNSKRSSKKSTKSKNMKIPSEYENINSNSTSNNYEEDRNMKNLINILKQKKIKSLKVCKDSFSLNSKKNKPILLDEFPKFLKNHYKNERFSNRIQHQNDFYYEQDNNYNIKQYKNPTFDFEICRKKTNQFLKQQSENINIMNDVYSSKYIISNKNNSQYCISSLSKYSHNKKIKHSNSRLKLKNNKKIKILYDLYCGKPDPKIKIMNRIKSALSVRKKKTKKELCKGMSEFNLMKNYNHYGNLNHEYMLNNKKNWLFKIIKLKKNNKRICPYEKHFGSNESCPLCQEMEKKNEESIINKGISPDTSAKKKNGSKTSLQKRRIYSATSKNFGTKNNSSKSDICGDFDNEYNKTRNLQTNRSNFNSIMINDNNKLMNKNKKNMNFNMIKRKLKFNRDIYPESNFSYSNNNNNI